MREPVTSVRIRGARYVFTNRLLLHWFLYSNNNRTVIIFRRPTSSNRTYINQLVHLQRHMAHLGINFELVIQLAIEQAHFCFVLWEKDEEGPIV